MKRPPRDEERELRIANEIVVDAYGPAEQATGWYCYLEDQLQFPFRARCVAERVISFLCPGDEVEVIGLAPDDECEHEMFVMTRWKGRTGAVPLSQLAGVGVDDLTEQAVGDWHYWVNSGYEF
jgi:Calcium binding